MILLAPTAFKGTIDAGAAAAAMADGARRAAPGRRVLEMPLSDGGPGLLDAIGAAGGRTERVVVSGPLGEPATARVRRSDESAVIESADACGLHLIPPARRDPLAATTYGVGQLLLAATSGDVAPKRVVVGLGGSATVDGGAGFASALGWRLEDAAGHGIGPGGGELRRLARIRPPPQTPRLPPVLGLVDVRNPLLGEAGAARVFGPQKGADAEAVDRLEAGLRVLADRLTEDLGRDVRQLAGAGAAGGLGAGLVAFAGGELVPGSEWVLDVVRFDAALARASLVVTGEGRFDEQSALGKITGAVIARADVRGVPVLLVAGSVAAPTPPGVVAVDGGGRQLTADALAGIVAREIPRLLTGERRP